MSLAPQTMDYAAARAAMVKRQIERRGIRDPRVLAAMLAVPREEFLQPNFRHWSYADEPAPIGHDQTISQPYMCALMAECLALQGHENVLDVGAGSGYMAAVLAELAASVVAVEIVPELAEFARRNLARCGYAERVAVVEGDGSMGWPATAPYQGISVDAAAPEAPAALLDQLDDPGRMVIPVGTMGEQALKVITRSEGKVSSRMATYCRFVPLLGAAGFPA